MADLIVNAGGNFFQSMMARNHHGLIVKVAVVLLVSLKIPGRGLSTPFKVLYNGCKLAHMKYVGCIWELRSDR